MKIPWLGVSSSSYRRHSNATAASAIRGGAIRFEASGVNPTTSSSLSRAYRKLAAESKMTVLMSRRANAWDNAPMQSFFKTRKVERIYQVHYGTRAEARLDIVDRIEGYYNRQRLHTSIDFCTPVDYEARMTAA